MIILDTNVVLEPLRPQPDVAVLHWLNAQEPQTLYLTSVSLGELLAGIEALPAGRRRTQLAKAFAERLMPLFAGHILAFDERAARSFAQVNTAARTHGNALGFADAAIAAVAAAHGFIVATRNVRDFRGTGVDTLDPWKA